MAPTSYTCMILSSVLQSLEQHYRNNSDNFTLIHSAVKVEFLNIGSGKVGQRCTFPDPNRLRLYTA
jgi:hypothetical protein